MPFTVGYLQRQARWGWGVSMGEHRAAAAINELKRRKILVPAGSYRSKRHGYRVTLYLLAQVISSVRRRSPVKWWQHPLFGNPGGEKPRTRRKRRRRARFRVRGTR